MPSYNSSKTISESIHSIQEQSYKNWELLVIDDGSTDNTVNIVLDMIKSDNRIKFYQNTKKGVSSARNHGIDNASGDYICFLDSDDLYSKDVVKNRLIFMQENHAKATTCEIVLTDENFGDLGWIMKGKKVFSFEDFHGCPVHTNSVMFEKSVFKELRFDENFSNGEDWLMWQRIARMGINFYHVEECRIYYRQLEGSVRKNFLKHENSLLDVIDIVYGEDHDCPNPLPKYANGLLSRNKEKTILKRRIGLFNYLLLENKLKEAHEVGQEILKNKAELDIKDIITTIKYSTIRYYLCHVNEHADYIKNNKFLKKNYKIFFSSDVYEELNKHFFSSKVNKTVEYLKKIKVKVKMHISKVNKIKDKIKKLLRKFRRKNNKANVIYLPGFENQERFEDQYLRLIWYIHPIIDSIEKIFIPIDINKIYTSKKINIPSYLDKNILKLEKKIKNKIKYFNHEDLTLWEKSLSESKISLIWNIEKRYSNHTDSLIDKYKKRMKNWRVDHNNVQFAASLFLKFSSEFDKDSKKNLLESQNIFNEFIQKTKLLNLKKSYIFGTGPSLDEASKDSIVFDDGITIACNSMVKNQKLLQKLNPKLFVASDPIFHAGCSAYAEEYRKNLFISLDTFPEALLIVPFRDYILYRKNLPKRFYKRIVGIPFEYLEDSNFNIVQDFKVKSTSNVMTNLLIPLATTMTNEVYMLGYDGRKMEDNEYYWDHNKKAQFNEQMENIQVAHPSFFTVNYDDYYTEHCDTLEKIFSSGESQGYKFINQTHSYIPALIKRSEINMHI